MMDFGSAFYWFAGPASMLMAALLVMYFARDKDSRAK